MACEQFFTECKYCGKKILMTKSKWNGSWIPCDPNLYRFTPSGGPTTYITGEGEVIRGHKDRDGKSYGYMAHRRSCKG